MAIQVTENNNNSVAGSHHSALQLILEMIFISLAKALLGGTDREESIHLFAKDNAQVHDQ